MKETKKLNGCQKFYETMRVKGIYNALAMEKFTEFKTDKIPGKIRNMMNFLTSHASNEKNGEFHFYQITLEDLRKKFSSDFSEDGRFYKRDIVSFDDLVTTVKLLYQSNKVLYTVMRNRNNVITLCSHRYEDNFYTVNPRKVAEKKDGEAEKEEIADNDKMDIAIQDAIALLKAHGYTVLSNDEFEIIEEKEEAIA